MAYSNFRQLGKNRYKNAVETLRKYTTDIFTPSQGFNLKNIDSLTKSQKAKIRRYFKEFDQLTARPFEPVKIRDKSKLIKVQKAAQHEHLLGKFNVAFVPSDGINKPVIKIDRLGHVRFKVGNITKEVLHVDPKQLSLFPDEVIQEVIKQTPNARAWRILCGKYEYSTATFTSGKTLTAQIKKFQQKYANHEEWLNGIMAYYYDNNKQIADYTKHVKEQREKLANSRRAANSRREYAKQRDQFNKQYGARLQREKEKLEQKHKKELDKLKRRK